MAFSGATENTLGCYISFQQGQIQQHVITEAHVSCSHKTPSEERYTYR